MFGKSDLIEILSRDLARARNKRDAFASDIISLTAEIAVLEASLLTENDRRERERAASEIERFTKQVNDQYRFAAQLKWQWQLPQRLVNLMSYC